MIIPRRTYLDHNATTPVDPQVISAMARALEGNHGNAASLHTEGRLAEGALREARVAVAALINAPPDRIVFTSGGTEANNTIVRGVFEARGSGHIVTTAMEHESILGAGAEVGRRGGRVTFLKPGADGRVLPSQVREALCPDTILVSVMHANNETGAVQPVEEIGAICRERKVAFHTDAVQSAGKIAVDVERIGCDFLTLTAHKINGPKGIGAFYFGAPGGLFRPLVLGGDQESGLRAGTVAVHQVVGFGAAARLRAERRAADHARLTELRAELVEGLRSAWPEVRINGAEPAWQLPGTVNALFPGKSGLHLLAGLDCYEVSVSIGSACTADRIEPSHVLLAMGLSEAEALSSIRISMGATTRRGDVKQVVKVLREVLRGDPPGLGYLDPQHLTEERIRSEQAFLVDLSMPTTALFRPTLPMARKWSYVGFDRHIKEIPRDREAILICDTGAFSLAGGWRLAQSGHPRVRVVYGGYAAWRALHPELVAKLCR